MKARYFSLFAALAMLTLPGCSTSRHGKAHSVEYHTLTTVKEMSESDLNRLGKEGWVVVGFTFATDAYSHAMYHYILKRPAK
jgi:hypothetical protein